MQPLRSCCGESGQFCCATHLPSAHAAASRAAHGQPGTVPPAHGCCACSAFMSPRALVSTLLGQLHSQKAFGVTCGSTLSLGPQGLLLSARIVPVCTETFRTSGRGAAGIGSCRRRPDAVTCTSEQNPGVLLRKARRNLGDTITKLETVSPRSVDYILHPELSKNSAISIHLPFKTVKKITSSFKERKRERKICSKLSCVCF